jgi:hypothetical protein
VGRAAGELEVQRQRRLEVGKGLGDERDAVVALRMPGLLPHIDPDGLLEYSVVYTDRALNHMSQRFQGVMRDISGVLKEVYHAARRWSCRAAAPSAWRRWRASSPPASKCLVIRNGWFSYRWTQIFEMGASRRADVLKARPVAAAARRLRAGADRGGGGRHPRGAPGVVFAPHVETAAGMILPDDYLRPWPTRCTRWAACSCSTASPPARCGWTWPPPASTCWSARRRRAGAARPAAPGDAERARPRRHRRHHQHQLRLRPEEVAADHGDLRRRRPRLPHHHAHRRAGPPARRDAGDPRLRLRESAPSSRNWAAGARAAGAKAPASQRGRRGLPGARAWW